MPQNKTYVHPANTEHLLKCQGTDIQNPSCNEMHLAFTQRLKNVLQRKERKFIQTIRFQVSIQFVVPGNGGFPHLIQQHFR